MFNSDLVPGSAHGKELGPSCVVSSTKRGPQSPESIHHLEASTFQKLIFFFLSGEGWSLIYEEYCLAGVSDGSQAVILTIVPNVDA